MIAEHTIKRNGVIYKPGDHIVDNVEESVGDNVEKPVEKRKRTRKSSTVSEE